MESSGDLFTQLVLGLQSSAWMLLGKVPNPATGQIYKNLEEANRTIEILMMLEHKTKGNLSDTEVTTLSTTIQQLQVNYVDEVKQESSRVNTPEDVEKMNSNEKSDDSSVNKK